MKIIRFKILFYFLFLNGLNVFGQFEFTTNDTNYFEIVNRFYSDSLNLDSTVEDGQLTHFRRWQEFWGNRVGASGSLRRVAGIIHNYIDNNSSQTRATSFQDNWEPLGPFGRPLAGSFSSQNSRGNGQMRRIAFDPDDPNIIYSCAYIGGLWRGEDPGTGLFNWTPLSDNTSPMGCGDVWVEKFIDGNSVSHKLIFISLGPGEGGFTRMGLGIYRSEDGGAFTAVNQGLQTSIDYFHIARILGHPTDPDIVFVATDIGVFKTINATSTCSWSQVLTGTNEPFRGLAFKPGDPSVVYASGKDIYMSTADGNSGTWNPIAGTDLIAEYGSLPKLINIEVTTQTGFEDELFATFITQAGQQFVWRFDGSSWSILGRVQSFFGNYTDRLALVVSPSDHDMVFSASDIVCRRTLHGTTWQFDDIQGGYSNGMVHPDIHDLKFDANNNLLVACDGGIYKSSNPFVSTPTFIDVSDGLQTNLILGMATSPSDEDIIVAGAWDCGIMYSDNATQNPNTYTAELGGDGGQCNIDNSNKIYFTNIPESGAASIKYSDNNFTSETNMGKDPEVWMTADFHHEIGPISQQLYSVTNNIWRYDPTLSNPWVRISHMQTDFPNLFNSSTCGVKISAIGIAPSNENIIYASTDLLMCGISYLFKTSTNGGSTPNCNDGSTTCWSLLSPPITESITDIVVDPENPEHVYITCSGYSINQKVFESLDGGANWNNISDGIDEAIPVNCIVYEKGSNGGIYVGTDVGVYYRNNDMTSWIAYFDNIFPHCIVTDLEINYKINKIRAATFGRGIWQSPLFCPSDFDLTLNGTVTQNQFKEAENNIFSTEISNNINNTYRAGTSIELNPGFETSNSSSVFYAYIHPCNHPGNSFKKTNPLIIEPKTTEKNIESDIISIFPNPSDGNFTIRFFEAPIKPNSILVSDITGKSILLMENVTQQEILMKLENQPKGIYVVKIKLGERFFFYKISLI